MNPQDGVRTLSSLLNIITEMLSRPDVDQDA